MLVIRKNHQIQKDGYGGDLLSKSSKSKESNAVNFPNHRVQSINWQT